jgi:two-component system response regulator VicR
MTEPTFSEAAGKLVLIVDDERGIRELLEIVMQKEGFRVALAEDGEEALQKVRELTPDLILLDLMLPKYGGFEILRELQAGDHGEIPIIVMTGRMMDTSTAEMLKRESNVREFIEKPIRREALVARIHHFLKTRPQPKKPA